LFLFFGFGLGEVSLSIEIYVQWARGMDGTNRAITHTISFLLWVFWIPCTSNATITTPTNTVLESLPSSLHWVWSTGYIGRDKPFTPCLQDCLCAISLRRRQIVNRTFHTLLIVSLPEEKNFVSRWAGFATDVWTTHLSQTITKHSSQQSIYLRNNASTLHIRSTASPTCTSADRTTSGHHKAAPQIAQAILFPPNSTPSTVPFPNPLANDVTLEQTKQ
jgi:hypothetical protein